MHNIVAIVQARMGSSRLPGKVMKDLVGKPLLHHIIERLQAAKKIDKIVIATSDRPENKVVVQLSKKLDIDYFIGSEDDVLDRYVKAAKHFNAGTIVRITADEPLIDPEIVDEAIVKHMGSGADFTTTMRKIIVSDGVYPEVDRTFPKGVDVEVLSIKALERIAKQATLAEDREHVTLYVHRNEKVFEIAHVDAQGKLKRPEITLTVDTEEDFNRAEDIFRNLYPKDRAFNTEDIIDFLDSK